PSTCTTARSYAGERPTNRAFVVTPLSVTTWTVPPFAATETTWLLVRMCPELSMTKPEPVPRAELPSTLSWTTLGSSGWATSATEPARIRGAGPFPIAGPDSSPVPVRSSRPTTASAAPAPARTPTTSAITAARPVTRLERTGGEGGGGRLRGGCV